MTEYFTNLMICINDDYYRVLCSIRRLPGLKLVVVALLKSVVPIVNVIPVVVLVFMLFSIVAVSYLKGGLSHCTGAAWDGLTDAQRSYVVHPVTYAALPTIAKESWGFHNRSAYACYDDGWSGEFERGVGSMCTSKVVCEWMLGSDAWQPVVRQSFDNVLEGVYALLQICTNEDWVNQTFLFECFLFL